MSPVVITVRTLGPSGTHVLPALNSQSGRKGQRSSWASNHLSKTASPRSHPARRGGRPRNRSPSLAPGNRFPVTQQEPSLWTVILWVTHRWPLPGAGAGMSAREASHSRGGLGCVSVAWSMAGPGGSPGRAPEEGKARRAAPGAPLHPHTENFMFVLSQEAHVSLVYRERRVGRPTGELPLSSVPGGWVSTAEEEGDVRPTQRCPGCPKSHRGMAREGWWPHGYLRTSPFTLFGIGIVCVISQPGGRNSDTSRT